MRVKRLLAVGLTVFACLAVAAVAEEKTETKTEKKVRKLQIGVKKRVDPEKCKIKSRKGDTLHVKYVGKLENGTVIDQSDDYTSPFTFTLGVGQMIKGWDQGLLGMCEGEKRKLSIPPELAFGAKGAPPKIPEDAVLVFEMELVKIERKDEL